MSAMALTYVQVQDFLSCKIYEHEKVLGSKNIRQTSRLTNACLCIAPSKKDARKKREQQRASEKRPKV